MARRIVRAISSLSPQSKVFVGDSDRDDPVRFVCDGFYQVNKDLDIDELISICKAADITAILPWNDNDIWTLSASLEDFQDVGIHVCVPPPAVVRIAHDKLRMYEWCANTEVPTPPVVPFEVALNEEAENKWIAKPRFGQGSVGLVRLESIRQLRAQPELGSSTDYVIQPIVHGREFTIDVGVCNSRILYCVPRIRLKVRESESYVGQVRLDKDIIAFVSDLVLKFECDALLNVQVIQDDNHIFLIEINPRLASGSDLSIEAGARIDHHISRWALDGKLSFSGTPEIIDGLKMSRYPEAYYF